MRICFQSCQEVCLVNVTAAIGGQVHGSANSAVHKHTSNTIQMRQRKRFDVRWRLATLLHYRFTFAAQTL